MKNFEKSQVSWTVAQQKKTKKQQKTKTKVVFF